MDEALFKELFESVKQMDEIARGERKPSREYHFHEADVKAIREKTGLSQSQFALLIRRRFLPQEIQLDKSFNPARIK